MLTAQQLAHTNDLHIVIRHLLAGLGHGIHPGKERGAGVEFSEYRSYSAGDEWRRIDWKLMARTDRYFVREAERDSHVAVWLCVDASASMLQRSQQADINKWQYARAVTATLASIAHRQGDAFGLLLLQKNRLHILPAQRGARHLQRLFALLLRTTATGAMPNESAWQSIQKLTRAPSLIFAISDFLDSESHLLTMLKRWRTLGHDVRAMALQSDIERQALLTVNQALFDGENTAQLHHYSDAIKNDYLQRYQTHYAKWSQTMRQRDIPAWLTSIEQSPESFLRQCLKPVSR